MKLKLIIASALMASGVVQAAPVKFKNCKSDVFTEEFPSCDGGEGSSCGFDQKVKRTVWGSASVDLTVDSAKKTAEATVTYSPTKGAQQKMTAECSISEGPSRWMECVTDEVPTLGKLDITFNVNGTAPNNFNVLIYADATNVPLGQFGAPADCQK